MKFGYTIIYVPSVPDALAFYGKAFGIATRFLHDSNTYGELETGATALAFASHELGEANFAGGYQRVDPSQAPLGIEIAFVTPDVPAAFDRAVAAGCVAVSSPTQKPWGQTVAYVRSAEGSLVELCSPIA